MSYLYEYKGKRYPKYLKEWQAGSYIFPIAAKFCSGLGLDIGGDVLGGCVFPGAMAINVNFPDQFDAFNLPESVRGFDYIFSSHTLEHIAEYRKALQCWIARLKQGGILFLYLPHPDMEYWHPDNCAKHWHSFKPGDMANTLTELGLKNVITSKRDLYWSFCAVGVKE